MREGQGARRCIGVPPRWLVGMCRTHGERWVHNGHRGKVSGVGLAGGSRYPLVRRHEEMLCHPVWFWGCPVPAPSGAGHGLTLIWVGVLVTAMAASRCGDLFVLFVPAPIRGVVLVLWLTRYATRIPRAVSAPGRCTRLTATRLPAWLRSAPLPQDGRRPHRRRVRLWHGRWPRRRVSLLTRARWK